jgi:L-glyceraldehyde 3-phosphate reductase
MFDRWIEETGLLDALAEHGVGISFATCARDADYRYLQGIPDGSRASKPHGFLKPDRVTPEKLAIVSKLRDMAVARGQNTAQLALSWVLRDARLP